MTTWQTVKVCRECGHVDHRSWNGRWLAVCPDCGSEPTMIVNNWPDLWERHVARRVGFLRRRWQFKESRHATR